MSPRVDRRTVRLQLLPMAAPDAPPVGQTTLATWGAPAETVATTVPSLCLCPGEVGELLIRLECDRPESQRPESQRPESQRPEGDRPLRYTLQVRSAIPPSWYHLRTEGTELHPRRPSEAVIRFRPEATVFETRLASDQPTTLDYSGEVWVCREDTGEPLASEPFQVHLRPRSLYPEFLPAVYREVDFIGRLLKIFEQSFEPSVNTLQTLWAYLDPLTAPEALLPFLAQWVGWPTVGTWSVAQQRSLIRRAMEIYRWRGTRRGLQTYLHLYTGLPLVDPSRPPQQQPIQVHTATRRGFVLGETELGPQAKLGGGRPLHFSVRLCPPADWAIDEALVRQIIHQEKPAVCTYDLEIAPLPVAPVAAEESVYVKRP
jgi:phage tail-like protein